jgi:hypothetical protein
MRIVDAQVHIWSHGPPTVPTHRQIPVFSKDSLLREMDEAGVDAAVLHPPASRHAFHAFIAMATRATRPESVEY